MYFPLKDKRKISIFTMYFTKIFENTFQSISFVESYSIYNRVIFFLGMEPRSTIIKYKLNFEYTRSNGGEAKASMLSSREKSSLLLSKQ